MFQTLKNAWRIPDTRKKILFTLFIVLLYRIGNVIPVPYVNSEVVFANLNKDGTIFEWLGSMSGGSFVEGTLFALSITPYITSSIVMQLLTIAIPALERMSKEQDGQKKITQITRYVTVALALITATGYYLTLRNTNNALYDKSVFAAFVIIACYVAGACVIMWLGEKINDHGIGNGISIILFFNILSGLAQRINVVKVISNTDNALIVFIIAILLFLILTTAIVIMNDAERRLPVQYAKRTVGRKTYGGMNTHLPIKLMMSGVMPIIFASSIVSLPSTIDMLINGSDKMGQGIFKYLDMTSPLGVFINFVLIIAFAYFYLSISFNPVEVANNLKMNGGTILGHRPGAPTAAYIKKVLNRVTLIGAIFLGIVSVLPQLLAILWPESYLSNLVFMGSSIIIVVGVVLETFRELDSEVTMRHYKGFLE